MAKEKYPIYFTAAQLAKDLNISRQAISKQNFNKNLAGKIIIDPNSAEGRGAYEYYISKKNEKNEVDHSEVKILAKSEPMNQHQDFNFNLNNNSMDQDDVTMVEVKKNYLQVKLLRELADYNQTIDNLLSADIVHSMTFEFMSKLKRSMKNAAEQSSVEINKYFEINLNETTVSSIIEQALKTELEIAIKSMQSNTIWGDK